MEQQKQPTHKRKRINKKQPAASAKPNGVVELSDRSINLVATLGLPKASVFKTPN